jgi:hypothetical protein
MTVYALGLFDYFFLPAYTSPLSAYAGKKMNMPFHSVRIKIKISQDYQQASQDALKVLSIASLALPLLKEYHSLYWFR